MTDTSRKETKFGNIKNWIIGATSVLIAVPALINAGIDIVVHVKKLPRTEAESINLALFKKHWGKDALAGGVVPVKTNLGMVELQFRVYDGGDIYTKYGNSSKWFPSPLKPRRSTSLLFPPAYAQTVKRAGGTAGQHFKMNTPVKGSYTAEIIKPGSHQKRVYKVNPLTGTWNAQKGGGFAAPSIGAKPGFKYRTFPTIDLTKK